MLWNVRTQVALSYEGRSDRQPQLRDDRRKTYLHRGKQRLVEGNTETKPINLVSVQNTSNLMHVTKSSLRHFLRDLAASRCHDFANSCQCCVTIIAIFFAAALNGLSLLSSPNALTASKDLYFNSSGTFQSASLFFLMLRL